MRWPGAWRGLADIGLGYRCLVTHVVTGESSPTHSAMLRETPRDRKQECVPVRTARIMVRMVRVGACLNYMVGVVGGLLRTGLFASLICPLKNYCQF